MSEIHPRGITMRRLTLALLLLWLGAATSPAAEPSKTDRELFARTKAMADKGEAEAQFQLASLYANGIGVAKDASKAAKWHRRAADQGFARAQYALALDYAEGYGVKADADEAFRWLQKAAEQGLGEAQVALGRGYADGEGVRANAVEAVKWFRKAADQGLPTGEYELGNCYFEGTGVSKDLTEGLKWVRQAAEQGNGTAQARLGACYLKGEAVTKDYVQAYKWFNLATAQEDLKAGDARIELAKLEALLTKDQIAEAQRLAHEFKPGRKPALGTAPTDSVPNAPGPAAKLGFVNVKADDESSEVFVDGAFVGNPPARLKLAEGAHIVEVKKPGFKLYRREITVGNDSDLTLRVVLEKE